MEYRYIGERTLTNGDEMAKFNQDVTVVNSVEELATLSSSKAATPDYFINKALIFIRFRYASSDVDNDREFGVRFCCFKANPSDGTLAKAVFDIKGISGGLQTDDINMKIFVFEIDRKNLSEAKEIEIAVHNLNSKKYGAAYYPLESKN